MAPDASRNNERMIPSNSQHYTMKTTSRPALTSSRSHHHPRHSQTTMQALRANNRPSTTPLASPRMPHSVGQPYPPAAKLSPGIGSHARSPSPNYFGLDIDSQSDLRDSAAAPLDRWSPQTSSVKSFGAGLPKQVSIDANPEFEAFRRQADANRANGFHLSGSQFMSSSSALRPKNFRRPTNQSEASDVSVRRLPSSNLKDNGANRMDVDTESLHDSAYVSSDSKRNSDVSLNSPSFSGMLRFESPAQADSPFEQVRKSNLSKVDDRHPRLSLPPSNQTESAGKPTKPRSETLPTTLESGEPGLMLPSQLKSMLKNAPENEYLLLDVRVSTHYAQSRIRGGLNLCIPTTLLKRATFDLEKLQNTLQTEEDQDKFAEWPTVKYLVVYDASSSEKRDAVPATNMLKKFTNAGFSGDAYLLRGGFHAFAAAYPAYVDHQSAAERGGTALSPAKGRPSFAPVIGGVTLPSGANNPNPFFSNIRQNMDLADGVGQMDISVPPTLELDSLPRWLEETTKIADHGKKVADRFLKIEQGEQSRMKDAYSAFNARSVPETNVEKIQLSGVEKGVKNRYKDILPFEHARVHLADRPEGTCDYINASHVQASRSHKRYIAAQGPLPATFEDFWSVVWDQDVRVVVMLTAEQEGGQLKCHPYWREREFGPLKLQPLSEKKVSLDIDKHRSNSAAELGRRRANTTTVVGSPNPSPQPLPPQSETPHVVVRKFALSHGSHPFAPIREITHLHYSAWPDFGTPAQPSHLLALIELANAVQRAALPIDNSASVIGEQPAALSWFDEPESDANARPMLVHCSAGCGRTGTFCTVDSVIDMLKRQRLASLNATKPRDAEGDVDMDEPLPPRSSTKKARHDIRGSPTRDVAGGAETTSWVANNGLDLIELTVEDFRKQRLSMVQSLRQFVLCYETVAEWVWRVQERSNGKGKHYRSGSLQTRR